MHNHVWPLRTFTLSVCIKLMSFSCFQGKPWAPGVVYVGHLPIGLFEPQLKAYFEQFGKVLRLRLSRSKKVSGLSALLFSRSVFFPSDVWLGLKMSSDVTMVWGQITEPTACRCIKLIACSHSGTVIKPLFPQKQQETYKRLLKVLPFYIFIYFYQWCSFCCLDLTFAVSLQSKKINNKKVFWNGCSITVQPFDLQTGGSKGYAFIEFDCVEVAKIVAETMNNYLMGERIIKCEHHSASSLQLPIRTPVTEQMFVPLSIPPRQATSCRRRRCTRSCLKAPARSSRSRWTPPCSATTRGPRTSRSQRPQRSCCTKRTSCARDWRRRASTTTSLDL